MRAIFPLHPDSVPNDLVRLVAVQFNPWLLLAAVAAAQLVCCPPLFFVFAKVRLEPLSFCDACVCLRFASTPSNGSLFDRTLVRCCSQDRVVDGELGAERNAGMRLSDSSGLQRSSSHRGDPCVLSAVRRFDQSAPLWRRRRELVHHGLPGQLNGLSSPFANRSSDARASVRPFTAISLVCASPDGVLYDVWRVLWNVAVAMGQGDVCFAGSWFFV